MYGISLDMKICHAHSLIKQNRKVGGWNGISLDMKICHARWSSKIEKSEDEGVLLLHTKWKTLYVCHILIWEQIDQRNLHYGSWIHQVAMNFRGHGFSFEWIHPYFGQRSSTLYIIALQLLPPCFIHTAHSSKLCAGIPTAFMKQKSAPMNTDTDTTTFRCNSIAEAAEKDRLNKERKARNQRRYYQKYVDSTFLKTFR